MRFIKNITSVLSRPFPEEESWAGYIWKTLLFGLFIALFLYIFQPFGISNLEENKGWICLGFGGMTVVGVLLFELIVDVVLKLKAKREQWTFGKWVVHTLGIMFTISLTNFLFARLALFGFIQWDLYPPMLYGTFMVGVLPVVAMGAFSMMRQELKHQAIAADFSPKNQVELTAQGPTVFDIPTAKIRYVEALQNYVQIGYLQANEDFKIQTERTTLKAMAKQLEHTAIVRCHRSYLVNKNAIRSATGNAQGLMLTLSGCDKKVPVSRSHVPSFKTA